MRGCVSGQRVTWCLPGKCNLKQKEGEICGEKLGKLCRGSDIWAVKNGSVSTSRDRGECRSRK